MSGVALALCSALLFGGMSIALGFSMRRSRDALVGAFATAFSGFCVCAVVALVGREWGGQLWPYMLAGLLAPGGAQLLFVLGVREAGPAREHADLEVTGQMAGVEAADHPRPDHAHALDRHASTLTG